MRIVAGAWRGRNLAAPPGLGVRPSSERLREALFSMLASQLGSFDGLRVGDLYAGTGALGLEALSRGAAHATFIERDREALAALARNIEGLGAGPRATVMRTIVELAPRPPVACDVVFMDPPYGQQLVAPALAHLERTGWFAPGALIFVETERSAAFKHERLTVETVRDYGKARLHLLRYAGD